METMTGQGTQLETGAATWRLDPEHTTVSFAVRHMMITTVRGHFGRVSGELVLDEADPTRSRIEATIEAASLDTRIEARDAHLRSADFFDVENHPTLRFVSRRIDEVSPGRYGVVGDLTMRGVTREVHLEVREEGRGEDPWGQQKIAFSAEARIDRTAWGLEWNQALEAGGVLVGNEVRITIDAQAILS